MGFAGRGKDRRGGSGRSRSRLGQALRLRTSYSPKNLVLLRGLGRLAAGAGRSRQRGRAPPASQRGRGFHAARDSSRLSGSGPSTCFCISGARSAKYWVNPNWHWRISGGREPGERMERSGAGGAFPGDRGQCCHATRDLRLLRGSRRASGAAHGQTRHWAADAFMALEANRAASLRESRELAPVWKKRLPAAYWETLGRLNEEEARDLSTDGTVSPESKRLRLELTEMESAAGVGVSVMLAENFRTRSSLIHFQHGLGESDLLLSFYLGKQESYLWAVTRRQHRTTQTAGRV